MRSLLRSPGFTLLAVLTLAAGIGACAAIFSVVSAVLVRPLPYPEPDRLVGIWSKSQRSGNIYHLSSPDFLDVQARTDLFAAVTGFGTGPVAVTAAGSASRVDGAEVTADFFNVIGVRPAVGRVFELAEWQAGNAAIISNRLALRFFGDPARGVGASLRGDGRTFVVVGVMPEGFAYPSGTDMWVPSLNLDPSASRSAHNFEVAGRLQPGMALATASDALAALGARLAKAYPATNTNKSFTALPLIEHEIRGHRATIWTLLGAVLLVLLIACANVANLLLARGVARRRELAVRAALGASRTRLMLFQLRESAILAGLAALLGTAIGASGVRALIALAPVGIPRLTEVGLDWPTLCAACGLALLATLLTGAVPALAAARTDIVTGLKSGGAAFAGGRSRIRGALVVSQLALSLGLLTVAGLLLRSFWNLSQVDPGFRPERVLVMDVTFPASSEADAPRAFAFLDEMLRRGGELPGVSALSYGREMPLGPTGTNGLYLIEGRAEPQSGTGAQNALWRFIGPGYFAALGIPLRSGRDLDGNQRQPGVEQEAVINETMARASWPGQDPIGQRIRIGMSAAPRWMTIVGVIADVKQGTLDQAPGEELYVAAAQFPAANTQTRFIIRTPGAPEGLSEPFRRLAISVNPEVPVQFQTAAMILGETLAAPRFRAQLTGVFAGLALLIALVGVGGVMSLIVAGRRREVGIRLALGATRRGVVMLMLQEGLGFVALGLTLGGIIALGAGRVLQAQLFAVGAFDPLVFAVVGIGFALVAAIAILLPALRSARVLPTEALRIE